MKKLYFLFAITFLTALGIQAQVFVTSTGGTSPVNYPTMNGAITAINAGTHTGSIVLTFGTNDGTTNTTTTITESSGSTLQASGTGSASYTDILFTPVSSATSGITVQGDITTASSPLALLILNGADNVTFEGRTNPANPSDPRRLRFLNTSVAGTVGRLIRAQNGSENCTMSFMTLQGVGQLAGTAILFEVPTTTGLGAANIKDWTFNRCEFRGAAAAVVLTGNEASSAANELDNVTFTFCDFVNQIQRGIAANSAGAGATVNLGNVTVDDCNFFQESDYSIPGTFGNFRAIQLFGERASGGVYNFHRNRVFGYKTNPTGANTSWHAFLINMSNANSTLNFVNNHVALGLGLVGPGQTTTNQVFGMTGIQVQGAFAYTLNAFYNTVRLGGSYIGASASAGTNGMIITGGISTQVWNIKNNIFSSPRNSTPASSFHQAFYYQDNNAGDANDLYPTTMDVDNNAVFGSPFPIGWDGGIFAGMTAYLTDKASVGFNAAVTAADSNTVSVASAPSFISNSNPQLTGAAVQNIDYAGTPIAVTTDINGTTRSGVAPYKGAHENALAFFTNEAQVTSIQSIGKLPIPFAVPHVIRAFVRNGGAISINKNVTLNITGSNAFTDVQNVNIAPGQTVTVTFAPFSPTNPGTNTLTVSVPSDQVNSNNSLNQTQDVSANSFNYAVRIPPATQPVPLGGLGNGGAGTTGYIAARFFVNSPTNVNQIRAWFNGPASGSQCKLVIWDDDGVPAGTPGTILWQSNFFSPTPAIESQQVITVPNINVNGDFFVGTVQRFNSIGFAFQNENPIRSNTFYFRNDTSSVGWNDFSVNPANQFRFMIEPRLQVANDLGVTALTSPVVNSCFGPNQTVTFQVTNLGINTANFATNPLTLNSVANFSAFPPVVVNTGTLAAGATLDIPVSATYNMSANGTYNFNATLSWGPDLVPENNSLPAATARIKTAPTPLNFAQNFNTTPATFLPAGWASTGFVNTAGVGTDLVRGLRYTILPAAPLATVTLPKVGFLTANSAFRFELNMFDNNTTAAPILGGTDEIEIQISTNCGGSFTSAFVINASNYDQVTRGRTYAFSLAPFAGAEAIFRVVADWTGTGVGPSGTTIDLDNFQVTNCSSLNAWVGGSGGTVFPADRNQWNIGGNWCGGENPTVTTDRIVGPSAFSPIVNPSGSARDLTLLPGANLTITGGATALSVAGDLSASNNSITGTGTFAFAGSTPQTVSGSVTFGNATVSNSNASGVTISGGSSVNVVNTFAPGAGSSTTIAPTGTFTLVSSSPTSTGRIGQVTGGATVNGNVTIQRYLPITGPAWAFIGSPIVSSPFSQWASDFQITAPAPLGGTQNVISNSNPERASIFEYNEPLNAVDIDEKQKFGWRIPTTANIANGRGYRAYFNENWFTQPKRYIDNVGSIHTGNFNFSLTRTSGGTYEGWNLISNPYPSAIDWDSPSWSKTADINNAIYLWNASAGQYQAYLSPGPGAPGVATGFPPSAATPPNVIPLGQAFFVNVTSGTSSALTSTEGVKVTNTSGQMLRENVEVTNQLRVTLYNSAGRFDQSVVRFLDHATEGFDNNLDAYRFSAGRDEVSFFSNTGSDLIISSLPPVGNYKVVPMKTRFRASGHFRLNFTDLETFTATKIYLNDKFTNTISEITSNNEYSFDVNVSDGSFSSSQTRFELIFEYVPLVSINPSNNVNFNLYPNPLNGGSANVTIQGVVGDRVEIVLFDLYGKVVHKQTMSVNNKVVSDVLNVQLASGIYTAKCTVNGKTINHKLVVD